jgi:hypothetical protein
MFRSSEGAMGITEAIAADHAEAAALFDELAPLAGDDRRTTEAMTVVVRLAITLKTCALAEQKVLYEALRTAGDRLAAFAREAPHEHHLLDVALDKLLVLRPGPELQAVLAVTRRLYELQAGREQLELLPAVHDELPADEHAQLERDLDAEKKRLWPRFQRLVALG